MQRQIYFANGQASITQPEGADGYCLTQDKKTIVFYIGFWPVRAYTWTKEQGHRPVHPEDMLLAAITIINHRSSGLMHCRHKVAKALRYEEYLRLPGAAKAVYAALYRHAVGRDTIPRIEF